MTKFAARSPWPHGTGQWFRSRLMIVSADTAVRDDLIERWACADVVVAATPLEVIARLEADQDSISTTVVLAGAAGSASDAELEWFLESSYPWVRVVRLGRGDRHAMVGLERGVRAHA